VNVSGTLSTFKDIFDIHEKHFSKPILGLGLDFKVALTFTPFLLGLYQINCHTQATISWQYPAKPTVKLCFARFITNFEADRQIVNKANRQVKLLMLVEGRVKPLRVPFTESFLDNWRDSLNITVRDVRCIL